MEKNPKMFNALLSFYFSVSTLGMLRDGRGEMYTYPISDRVVNLGIVSI